VPAKTDNSIVIEAPLDRVWELMNDVESWPSLFTEYAKAEILEREGNKTTFRLTTHPDPEYDGQVWTWVSERTVDPENHTVTADRVETGPFEFMHIEWFFEPEGDHTLVRWVQEFSMKPTAPSNDEEAEDYINKNTRTQLSAIKERIEQQEQATSAA
jgi:aromatase